MKRYHFHTQNIPCRNESKFLTAQNGVLTQLFKERELEQAVVYEVEHESKLGKNLKEATEAVSLLHFMVAQSTSLFKSILATLSQIVN